MAFIYRTKYGTLYYVTESNEIKRVKKAWMGDKLVYRGGNIVTYYIDTDTVYQEYFDINSSVLSPTTFIPQKSGWEFVGWRTDTIASSSVITSKNMTGETITLYAVFRKTVNVYLYNDSTTYTTLSEYQYYNNGNNLGAIFTLSQSDKLNWTKRGWSASSVADANIDIQNGASISLNNDATYYGCYQKNITLSYDGNGSTDGTVAAQTGIRYYNSSNTYSNPTFTLSENGFSKSGYSFNKWALSSVSGAQYEPNSNIQLSDNTIMYALWTSNAFYADVVSHNWDISDLYEPYGFKNYFVTDDHISMEVSKDPDTGSYGVFTVSGTFDTKGCNKVRLDVRTSFGWGDEGITPNTINGVNLMNNTLGSPNYIDFDCTSDTFTVVLRAVDDTEYFTSRLSLYSIYFYNE